MQVVCIIIAIGFGVLGAAILSGATSANHKIEAFMLWLIGAVFLAVGLVINRMEAIRRQLRGPTKEMNREPLESRNTGHEIVAVEIETVAHQSASESDSERLLAQAVAEYKAGQQSLAEAMLRSIVASQAGTSAAAKAASALKQMAVFKQPDKC